jgi:hypothetical protein
MKYIKKISSDEGEKSIPPFIRELSNGNIIISRQENKINIYDQNLNLLKINLIHNANDNTNDNINDNSTKLYVITKNIIETNESQIQKSKDHIEIINCSNIISSYKKNNKLKLYSESVMTLYSSSNNENDLIEKKHFNVPCTGCFEIVKDKEYIIIGEKGIKYFNDSDELIDDTLPFKGGIKINNNYLALISNSIIPNGKDILVFYDIKSKKIIDLENGIKYSFNIGVNSLFLMKKENEDKGILLCACKKYYSSQKNGILIIVPEIKENEEINYNFYDTEEFEVNCFCQINQTSKKNNTKNIFFFAGGFDIEKRQGVKII